MIKDVCAITRAHLLCVGYDVVCSVGYVTRGTWILWFSVRTQIGWGVSRLLRCSPFVLLCMDIKI